MQVCDERLVEDAPLSRMCGGGRGQRTTVYRATVGIQWKHPMRAESWFDLEIQQDPRCYQDGRSAHLEVRANQC